MQPTPPKEDKNPLLIKYTDTFWNNLQVLIKESESSRAELKDFINLIENRIKIETNYAEKLTQLSKIENKTHRSSLSQELVNVYSASLKKKAEQNKNFSQLLSQTGLDKLQSFYESSGNELRKLKQQVKGYQKQLALVEEEYSKNLARTQKRKKEIDEIELQYLVSATCRQLAEKKQSLKIKVKQKYSQFTDLSKECKASYSSYSKIKKTYEKTMRQIVQTFYEQEREKLDRMIDSFVNIQLIESSQCKNRLVYLQEQSKFINLVKPETEIQKFINLHSFSQPTMLNRPSFKQSFLHNTFERMDSKKIQEIIKYGDSHKSSIKKVLQDITSLEQESSKAEPQALSIANYIRKMWQNTLCNQDSLIFDQQINNPLSRKDFVICLQQQRILGKFQINDQQLQSVVNTITRVLNKCFQQKDSYVAKHIMVLIFTYFINVKEGDTIKKEYLHTFLKQNIIWRSMQFWQSALIESLYEESKGTQQNLTTLNLKGINLNNEKQQNLVFNQLAYYVYNMILFDWEEKYVRQFASKFIKLYNLDQTLSKQIYDTIGRAKKSNGLDESMHEEIISTPSIISSLIKIFGDKETTA